MWPFTKKVPKPLKFEHSEWQIKYKCHCGYMQFQYFDLCPKCGCMETPDLKVGRSEWVEDPNIWMDRWENILPAQSRRNVITFQWVEKPLGCQAKKEKE